jgi:hypothetical protein
MEGEVSDCFRIWVIRSKFLATCRFYSQHPTEYEGHVLKQDHRHNIQSYIAISYTSTTGDILNLPPINLILIPDKSNINTSHHQVTA